MKTIRHLICLALVLSLTLCIVPAAQAAQVPFSDVEGGSWYTENVEYVFKHGLMNGMDGGKFDPEGTLTRAMLVTVLYRIEGQPHFIATSFEDVPSDSWFHDPISWAQTVGIVNGKTNTTFAPNDPITRQEVATILLRYAENFGYGGGESTDLSEFSDTSAVADWANRAMSWTVATELINGSDGKLLPEGNATRSQIAAILNRFCVNIMGNLFKSEYDVAMTYFAEYALEFGATYGNYARYDLAYIDGDNIPELVLTPSGAHLSQVRVYTFYEGDCVYLGNYGMYGTLPYVPFENAFGDYASPKMIVEGEVADTTFSGKNVVELYYGDLKAITEAGIRADLLGE